MHRITHHALHRLYSVVQNEPVVVVASSKSRGVHLKEVRYLVWHDSMMFGVTTINANWDVARSAIQRLRDSSSACTQYTDRTGMQREGSTARRVSESRRHHSGLLGWWCANDVAGDVVTCRLLQKRDGVAIAMIVGYNAGVERWVTMWLRWKCGRLLEAWSGPWKLDENAMQLIDFDDKLGLTKTGDVVPTTRHSATSSSGSDQQLLPSLQHHRQNTPLCDCAYCATHRTKL